MLGDVRHIRRAEAMLAGLAGCPAGSVGGAFSNAREARAAYERLEHPEVDWRDLAAASHRACARRYLAHWMIIVPIDGSSSSFTDSRRSKGLGPIGSHARGAQRVNVMTAYALSPEGIPLGVLAQSLWVRAQEADPTPHAKRPLHQDETRGQRPAGEGRGGGSGGLGGSRTQTGGWPQARFACRRGSAA
jgi:hypothetical protein